MISGRTIKRAAQASLIAVLIGGSGGPRSLWSQGVRQISLTEALRRAAELNPEARIAGVDAVAAQRLARAARLWAYNPEFDVGLGRLGGADSSRASYEFGIAQRFELGGKRGSRIAAADRRLVAAQSRQVRRRDEVAAQVTRVFLLAQVARMRLETAREAEQVAGQLKTAAEERLRLGAGTQLEVNVAAAAASRERRARLLSEQGYASAVIELAATIGLPGAERPEPAGDLSLPPPEDRPEAELVAIALDHRPDLRASIAEREASAADLRRARAFRWPDPALLATTGREESRLLRFSLSFSLPLLNQAQTERAEAAGFLDRALIVEDAHRRQVEREVRDAFQAYRRAREAYDAFDREVVERMSENLRLAEESFRAGKIGLLIFSTVRRDLVEARLSYLDAIAELVDWRTALALAVGEPHAAPTERQ